MRYKKKLLIFQSLLGTQPPNQNFVIHSEGGIAALGARRSDPELNTRIFVALAFAEANNLGR